MDQPVGDGGKAVGFDRDNEEPSNANIPVFMERVLCMIDDLSDDVVCWSAAGDSFIVKKASKKRPVENTKDRGHDSLLPPSKGAKFLRFWRRVCVEFTSCDIYTALVNQRGEYVGVACRKIWKFS